MGLISRLDRVSCGSVGTLARKPVLSQPRCSVIRHRGHSSGPPLIGIPDRPPGNQHGPSPLQGFLNICTFTDSLRRSSRLQVIRQLTR